MAREKGMGNLQKEKSGRWTMRVCIDGERYARSTRTRDKEKAERFLQRFLSPFGLGERLLPFAEVWREYEKSPNRRELSPATMNGKRLVWMHFAEWIEANHVEMTQLKQLTHEVVAEYLRVLRLHHCASTYNNRVCVLREICRVLAEQAGLEEDPWAGVRLLTDDSHTRREFTLDELNRIMAAAERVGAKWKTLFSIGVYTGLRLGDCCTLDWSSINSDRGIIQLIPRKTRKYAHGRPVTIPIHPTLAAVLGEKKDGPVLPEIASWYEGEEHWRISRGLEIIFKDAGIKTSVKIEGRRYAAPDATFHSLRHTFVSLAANAGVPLPVVQSIVGHSSTAMTRHYYHENEDVLRQAVAAIPAIGEREMGNGEWSGRGAGFSDRINKIDRIKGEGQRGRSASVPARLKRLDKYLAQGLITQEEHNIQRARILAEL